MNNINAINNTIKEHGWEYLTDKQKIIKAKDIWYRKIRKVSDDFENDRDGFVEWYLSHKKRVCHCCGVSEDDVRRYFYNNKDNKKITRNGKRGYMLEIDKENNFISEKPYNKDNMFLLCYVCNNAKSNFINNYDDFKPISDGIKVFWDNELKKSKIK